MSDLLPDDVDHLTDYVDEQEKTKETLRNTTTKLRKTKEN